MGTTAAPKLDLPESAAPVDLGNEGWELRRPARAEADAARNLQRLAFGLNGSCPPHPGSADELRVLVRDGEVLSCLTLIHARLHVGGVEVPMGGIRHVATHPDQQNKGYASALMRDTLACMKRCGLPLSLLFPFSFRYYRKFGYELGGNHCVLWCRPNSVPAFLERRDVRPAIPADAPALARAYRGHWAGRACTMVRDEARWRSLLADPALRIWTLGNPARAYLMLREGTDSYGGRVCHVLDLVAPDNTAWRALLGHLSQVQAESVEWLAPAAEVHASGLLASVAPLREGFKPRAIATVRPMFQLRVVDAAAALSARAAGFPAGDYSLRLVLHDDQVAANNRPLLIHCDSSGARVISAPVGEKGGVEMDIRTFAQIYGGYLSAGEAASQGFLHASSDADLDVADRLFPAGDPFISEVDRF